MRVQSPLVSIIIVTYNNENDIVDCLDSVLAQEPQDFEVIIVDNHSTDMTVSNIKNSFGENERIRIIESNENTGYAGGNNIGFQKSAGELIVLLNPDLVVDKGWLQKLLEANNYTSNAGIICSNVLLFDSRNTINACGNAIHLAGFVFSRFYMEEESKCFECKDSDELAKMVCQVAAPSGASMMFSRKNLYKIGRQVPFDSGRFFMDYSDIDLAVQFLSHDLLCYVAPKSRVFHKFHFKMTPERLSMLEKGRYQLLGHLTRSIIFLLIPSLVLAEILVWSFIVSDKQPNNKWKMVKSKLGSYSIGNMSRENNSKIKDLKIIKVMIPELIIYDEIFDRTRQDNQTSVTKGAHSLLNGFFRGSRDRLIRWLENSG